MDKKQFERLRTAETNSADYVKFDIASVLRDAIGSDAWQQKIGLWTAISGSCSDYSKTVYNKIEHFVQNLTDIDYCNVHALKSIAKEIGAENITEFIKEDYPVELSNLINLFSIPQNLIMQNAGIISDLALHDIVGSIDQRNKDIYLEKNGYSEILFYELLNNLDEIRYLLQTENGINFNFSIWNYVSFQNHEIPYYSLSAFLEKSGDDRFVSYTAPSLNKIFDELSYLKDQFNINYNAAKQVETINNTLVSSSVNRLSDEDVTSDKYKFAYQENFNDQYIGNYTSFELNKKYIIHKCCKPLKYKDCKIFANCCETLYKNTDNSDYLTLGDSSELSFGWNPYPNDVLNNIKHYTLINDLSVDDSIIFMNPFLMLIALLKNMMFNATTGKQLKLSYLDEKTNTTIDLSLLLLNCLQSIQTNTDAYYNEMMVYHFYGLFYDMIINDYLKNEWDLTLENNKITERYIGVYSEYTKEEFLEHLPKSIKSDALVEFFEHAPTYFNQYHVDFITYLNILNNLLSSEDYYQKEFSYIITNYNNDFEITAIKSAIYNEELRRLLGVTSSIEYVNDLNEVPDTTDVTVQVVLENSSIYLIAKKFADYCMQIRFAREALKNIVQKYARIGTTELIENLVKEYFYKNFTSRQDWNIQGDNDSYSHLTNYNLFNPCSAYLNNKNKISVDLIEYYDTTEYLNIYADRPRELYGYIDGDSEVVTVEKTVVTPSTYLVTYTLTDPVISSESSLEYLSASLLNSDTLATAKAQVDFDTIIDTTAGGPVTQYAPSIAAVSTLVSSYINSCLATEYCYCTYFYTNGYSIANSGSWTASDLTPTSSLITYPSTVSDEYITSSIVSTKAQILNQSLFLSSLYDTSSNEFKTLLEKNNIDYDTDILLSSIVAEPNVYIIPAGTVVGKYETAELSCTYNLLSTYVKQIPVYQDATITGTYNYRYWDFENTSNNSLSSILSSQLTFWQKYFPKLNEIETDELKIKYYKTKIYPFLSAVLDMHATSGFSDDLSGLQKLYAGDETGDYQTKNIANTAFPTIASVQNVANLVEQTEIDTENNLYINLYLNNFYSDLDTYSQNVLQSLLDCNINYNHTSYGYPVSGWHKQYTNFTGYNSVYGQSTNLDDAISYPDKTLTVDGPWVYSSLQNFIKLYYTSELYGISSTFNKFPLCFNRYIANQDTYRPISLNYEEDDVIGETKLNSYEILYDNIYDYVKNAYITVRTDDLRTEIAKKLFLYQHKIINKQFFTIYDYKEDMYGNAFTLFKHYKHNKYEDAGELWVRQKNHGLSIPVMFCREIDDTAEYSYDAEDFLIIREHNKYANMLKELMNNAVQFNIYDNKLWVLGYTHYAKINKTLTKEDTLYLKLCVFTYNYNNTLEKYVINLNSINCLSENSNLDYLNNINNFVGAYNNYSARCIEFILNDFNTLNNTLNNTYEEFKLSNKDMSTIDKYLDLNNLTLEFIKYSYSIDSTLSDPVTITMDHAKYPIIGLFTESQIINMPKFTQTYLNNSNIIENYLGYTIELYKKQENNLTENLMVKLSEATITYNEEYKSIDILFNKITNSVNYTLHKNCVDYNRNIIAVYYDTEKDEFVNLDFTGTFNNNYNGYFYFESQPNYFFKIKSYMKCNCNELDLSSDEKENIINTILALSEFTGKRDTDINLVVQGYLSQSITAEDYAVKFDFSKDIHLYFELIADQNRYDYYNVIYYIDGNTVVKKILGLREPVHKINCAYAVSEQENYQHIWKTNLNNGKLYIAYESINPNINESATYYKELFASEKNDMYIDTIIFEATLYKKLLSKNDYGNLIQDITIKYSSDKISLPFTFTELSGNLLPKDAYTLDENKNVTFNGTTDISWCLTYGEEFNRIHQSYPKCEINGNKLTCTTILSRLGGIKDFQYDISKNNKAIEFLANYILNSTFRKKIFNPSTNSIVPESSDAYKVFKSMEILNSKYCISDYLFLINQLKIFKGSEYFDYNFEDGFKNILDVLTTIDPEAKEAQKHVYIGNKSYYQYIKENNSEWQNAYTANENNTSDILTDQETSAVLSLINGSDGYEFFDIGFRYNFYPYSSENELMYLTYMQALPAFTNCFTDNLKIYVNFGTLSEEIKSFITDSESFDLDISVYIDDSEINGTEYLKKVGWHCGYTETDYLNWKSKDSIIAGPEIVEVNLQKYSNYLYNKLVLPNHHTNDPKYKYEEFNRIAENTKIHIEVCWHNESMLIALNPQVEIYWKGMYRKVNVSRSNIITNNKCCENSWGYDLIVDLRNNILKSDIVNTLYPVFTTELVTNKYYDISVAGQNWNTFNEINTNLANTELLSSTEILFTELSGTYSTYQIPEKDLYTFILGKTFADSTLTTNFLDMNANYLVKELSVADTINLFAELILNYDNDSKIEYISQKTTVNEVKSLFNWSIFTAYNASDSTQLVYNVLAAQYNTPSKENLLALFNLIITQKAITTTAKYIEFFTTYYDILSKYVSSEDLLALSCRPELSNLKFNIDVYNELIPSAFLQYYTSTDNISGLLKKETSNYYFKPLSLDLTSAGAPQLEAQFVQEIHSSENLTILDHSDNGYIIIVQKTDDLIRYNTVITKLENLMKSDYCLDCVATNYEDLDKAVLEYLTDTLNIETPSGIFNLTSKLEEHIPSQDLLVTPYLKYYTNSRKCSLMTYTNTNDLLDTYNDIKIRYKNGFYFDLPFAYQYVTKNILTNNFDITYTYGYNASYLNTSKTDSVLMENKNVFTITSEDLVDDKMTAFFPTFEEVYQDMGYDFELQSLSNNTNISNPSSITLQNSGLNKTQYLTELNNLPWYIANKNDQNYGLNTIVIKPYVIFKYIKRYIQEDTLIYSNYNKLFVYSLPSSSIENTPGYTLSSNVMTWCYNAFPNELISTNLNNYLTTDIANISFNADILNYPLNLVKTDQNTYLTSIDSGCSASVYQISVYEQLQDTNYLIGIISGLYNPKTINITNFYKQDKTNFVFTTNMTKTQIKSELLNKNIVSTLIEIPSSLININNVQYSDLDFISGTLEEKVGVNLKSYE